MTLDDMATHARFEHETCSKQAPFFGRQIFTVSHEISRDVSTISTLEELLPGCWFNRLSSTSMRPGTDNPAHFRDSGFAALGGFLHLVAE